MRPESTNTENKKDTKDKRKRTSTEDLMTMAKDKGGVSNIQMRRLKRTTIVGKHRLTGSMRIRETQIVRHRSRSGSDKLKSSPLSSSRGGGSRGCGKTKSGDRERESRGELQHTGFHHVMSIRVPAWRELDGLLRGIETTTEEKEKEKEKEKETEKEKDKEKQKEEEKKRKKECCKMRVFGSLYGS